MSATKSDLSESVKRAQALIAEDNLVEAAEVLEETLKDHPEKLELYSILCNLYLSLGRTQIPKDWVLNALKSDPSLEESFLDLSSRLFEKNELKECDKLLETLVWSHPDNHEIWNDLGAVRFTLNDLVTSERAFNQALALKPGYGEAITNLTALYMATNRPQLAVKTAMTSLKKTEEITPVQMREMGKLIKKVAPAEADALFGKAENKKDKWPNEGSAF